MDVSKNGVAFIAKHEGLRLNTYLDPAGIATIGYGFTMQSRVFAAFAQTKWGRPLRMGDSITQAEATTLLAELLEDEYATPVRKKFSALNQHQFDACVSVVYNCGAGTLNDRWAKALGEGNVVAASELLRNTRITAKGKRLQGLVNRRADEAELLLRGAYGAAVGGNVPIPRPKPNRAPEAAAVGSGAAATAIVASTGLPWWAMLIPIVLTLAFLIYRQVAK